MLPIAQWQLFLANIKSFAVTKELKPRNIFISYAWEGDGIATSWLHKRLCRLRDDLIGVGFNVFLDISHMNGDITETMRYELAESDIVFVICTPRYAERVQQRNPMTNAGYEYQHILGKLKENPHCVYPLWVAGGFKQAVPKELIDAQSLSEHTHQLLVRDYRDPWQDEWQLGSLSPLGIIPALYDIRLDMPVGQEYLSLWQVFVKEAWGEIGCPEGLLSSLQRASRTMLTTESIYEKIKAYYSEPNICLHRGGESIGNLKALFDDKVIPAAARDSHPAYILFGDSGMGKSTALLHFEERLWAEFPTHHIVPIRIPLNRISRETNDFVTAWLKEWCGYSREQIDALKRCYRLLLLLDGYDELVFNQGNRNLFFDAQLTQWPGAIIISCRSQLENECLIFDQYRRQNLQSPCERYYLNVFSAEQVQHYVSARANQDERLTPEICQVLERTPNLKALITTPLILFMIVDILPDLAPSLDLKQEMTRYHIYELFTEKWFAREFVRIIDERALANLNLRGRTRELWQMQLLHYAEHIAILMYQQSTTNILQENLEEEEQKFLEDVLHDKARTDEYVDILRNACPLKAIAKNEYQFVHKSFQEFLVAQSLWKLADLPESKRLSTAIDLLKKPPIQKEPQILEFLYEAWKAKPEQAKRLREIFLAVIIYSKTHPKISQSSANAATLLNAMAEYLNNLDWQGVQLPGADLSYGRLWNTNFSGANLENVYLAHAVLVNADLRNANLRGVRWGDPITFQFDKQISVMVKHPSKPWIAIAYEDNNEIILYDYKIKTFVSSPMQGHTHKITSLAFSSDGELLASAGGYDKSCRLWRVANQKPFGKILVGHTAAVNSLAFSPNSKYLASGSDDNTYRLWEVSSQNLMSPFPSKQYKKAIKSVAFSFDGKLLALGMGTTCQFISLSDLSEFGKTLETKKKETVFNIVTFSPNNQLLASGGTSENLCQLWRVADQEPIGEQMKGYHTAWITALAFDAKSEFLVSGAADAGRCCLWQVADQKLVGYPLVSDKGNIVGVSFSQEEQGLAIIAASTNKVCQLWEVANQKFVGRPLTTGNFHHLISCQNNLLMHEITDQGIRLWSALSLKPIGDFIAKRASIVFSQRANLFVLNEVYSKTVQLWCASDQKTIGEPLRLGYDTTPVCSMAFNPEGNLLVTGNADGSYRFWNVNAKSPLGPPVQAHTDFISSVNFGRDGQLLATGSRDGSCRLWKVSDQTKWGNPIIVPKGAVFFVVFSPDGELLATSGWEAICRLWSVKDQSSYAILEGHTENVTEIAFHPLLRGKETLLATGSIDKTCRLWAVIDQTCLKIFTGHVAEVWSLAFSPDGKYLATGGGESDAQRDPEDKKFICRIWKMEDYSLLCPPLIARASIFSLAFNSDSTLLALASQVGSGWQLWRISSNPVLVYSSFGQMIKVAFHPKKDVVAVGGQEQSQACVVLWQVDGQTPIASLKTIASSFQAITFSLNEKWLVSGHDDGTCQLWDVATDQKPYGRLIQAHNDQIIKIAFHPDGTLFASTGGDMICRLWQVDDDQKQIGDDLKVHTGNISDIVFSFDGKLIVLASWDSTCSLWNVETKTKIGMLKGHTKNVRAIAFSPDGIFLASVSDDKTCKLWKVLDQSCVLTIPWVRELNHVSFLVASALDYQLVVEDNLSILRWRLKNETLQPSFEDLTVTSNTPFIMQGARIEGAKLTDIERRLLVERYQAIDGKPLALGVVEQVSTLQAFKEEPKLEKADSFPFVIINEQEKFTTTKPMETDYAQAQLFWRLGDKAEQILTTGIELLRNKNKPIQDTPLVLMALYELWKSNSEKAYELKKLLMTVINYSKINKDIAQASANAATLLNAMGEHLNDLEWQGVQLPGADLSYGRLWNTNFSGANLQGACLAHAVLTGANLTGANLTRIDLGKYPKFKTKGRIHAITWHPHHPWLAIAEENKITLYHQMTNDVIGNPFKGHTDSVSSIAFSIDGKLLVSGSADKTCRLWQVANQQLFRLPLEGHTRAVTSVAFHPTNADLFASGSEDWTCRLWRVLEQTLWSKSFQGHTSQVLTIVFSPNGKLLASAGSDWTCRLWKVADQSTIGILEGHQNTVNSIAFHPEGKLFVSGGEDNTCRLWNTDNCTLVRKLMFGESTIKTVVFSPDGKLLVIGNSRACQLWKVEEQTHFKTLTIGSDYAAFNLKGASLALASSSGYQCWKVKNTYDQGRFFKDMDEIRHLNISSDTKMLGSVHWGSTRETCVLWQFSLEEPHHASMSFTKATPDCIFPRYWKTANRSRGFCNALDSSVTFNLTGDLLISNPYCKYWKVSNQTEVMTPFKQKYKKILISPKENYYVSIAGPESRSQLWDKSNNTVINSIPAHEFQVIRLAVFSPDETVLVWSYQSGSRIILCKIPECTLMGQLEEHARITSFAFHPTLDLLISSSDDGLCRVWQILNRAHIKSLLGHEGRVSNVVFSPNGKFIASVGDDKTCRLWQTSNYECLRILNLGEKIHTVCFLSKHSLADGMQDYYLIFGSTYHISLWSFSKEAEPKLEDITMTASTSLTIQELKLQDCKGLTVSDLRLLEEQGLDTTQHSLLFSKLFSEYQELQKKENIDLLKLETHPSIEDSKELSLVSECSSTLFSKDKSGRIEERDPRYNPRFS